VELATNDPLKGDLSSSVCVAYKDRLNGEKWIRKDMGQRLLPNFRCCSGIFLERLRISTIRICRMRSQILSLRRLNTKQGCVASSLQACVTRWFKYDRDCLCVNKSQLVPVIFEPTCIYTNFGYEGLWKQIVHYFFTNQLKTGHVFTPSLSNMNVIRSCVLRAPLMSP
jgi:hypothetical protein